MTNPWRVVLMFGLAVLLCGSSVQAQVAGGGAGSQTGGGLTDPQGGPGGDDDA